MSFNRTKYDSDAFKQDTNRSIAPGDYRLFESYPENINQCFSDFGPIGAKSDVSLVKPLYDLTFGDMAMTESNLSWRSHRLSKDTNSKKVEICNSAIDNNNLQSKLSCPKIHHKNDCSKKLIPEQPSYSLGKLVRALGIPMSDRHRASGDAIATTKLFKMLLEKDLYQHS